MSLPSLPLPSSSAPSKYRRQHHDIEQPAIDVRHFRAAWRVRARLDKLLLERAITPREFRAATEYRATVERGFGGLLGSNLDQIGTGRRPARSGPASRGERSEAQLAAVQRLAAVRASLGATAEALLLACIVEDLAWCRVGQRFAVDPKTGKAWVVASLRALAAIW